MRGENPMERENRRVDRQLLTIMYIQWVAALCLAFLFTPHTPFGAHLKVGTLLLSALLAGGLLTFISGMAVHRWNGRRKARIALGCCQMLMSVLLLFYLQGTASMDFHVYGSLAFLAFYADWTVLATASSTYMVASFLMSHIFFHSQSSVAHAHWAWMNEVLKLVLCNAFLLWSNRVRAREARSMGELQKRQHDQLQRAFHDSATSLLNRAAIEAHLEARLHTGMPVACIMVELDGIAAINDSAGPEASIELLRSAADRMRECVHREDLFGRYSTDRFVLLIHRPHAYSQLVGQAESFLRSLSIPHRVGGREMCTNTYIGIATSTSDSSDPATLLAEAERAATAVKDDGGNDYRFASDLRRPVDERQTRLSHKLERALLSGSLELVYQPIYNLAGAPVAAEALARWRDDEEGNISPGEFVPIAEATGLIVPLSNWVLAESCRQMVEWRKIDRAPRRIAVNVSVKQVWRRDFVETVENTLRRTGLPPECLELELTEGALAKDFETVKRHLRQLRRIGVRISIDDFGTGYSSLSRVQELDADTLKIDRKFIQSAGETSNGAAVVQAIIEMAHTLKLTVIAEGVETQDELNILRSMNCDEIQGFLLSRPQPAERLTRMFSANPIMPFLHSYPTVMSVTARA